MSALIAVSVTSRMGQVNSSQTTEETRRKERQALMQLALIVASYLVGYVPFTGKPCYSWALLPRNTITWTPPWDIFLYRRVLDVKTCVGYFDVNEAESCFFCSLRVLVSSTKWNYAAEQNYRLLVWNDWIFLSTFLRMPQSGNLQPRLSKDEEMHCRLASQIFWNVCLQTKSWITIANQLFCFWRR